MSGCSFLLLLFKIVQKSFGFFVRIVLSLFCMSFLLKTLKQKINNSKIHKPWFTVQCKFQRQNYRKLRRKYKRYKTDAVKNELAAAIRQYKRTLDISMSRHRKDSIKEHLI
jgi:hypothetical protein